MGTAEWAAIAAWAAVVVTIAVAVFTAKQASNARDALRHTREQAEAAKDQAHSARVSSEASSKSAMAAIDQAATSRAALDLARESQNRADRPEFELALEWRKNQAHVTARMLGGPPGIRADFIWLTEHSVPAGPGPSQTPINAGRGLGTPYEMHKNTVIEFPVAADPKSTKITARIIVESSDMDDPDRRWVHREDIRWERPPPARVSRVAIRQ
jgi:hypothetical protein